MSWDPELYLEALRFSSLAHAQQKLPGSEEPYLTHIAAVAAEVMFALAVRDDVKEPDLAVQCALLHDSVEDTEVTLDQVRARFGEAVAAGVAALTKDETLPDKAAKMADSLARIQKQPTEVWMVKVADRITNLQPPPGHWDAAKIAAYRKEALVIHAALAGSCPVLGQRLLEKIELYPPGNVRANP